MSRYSKEDIMRIVEEEDVAFIRLQFTDIFGMLKNLAITSGQLEKALENRYMFDGSAIEGFVRIEESDMYLYPDLNTFKILPWRPQQGKVARLICDVYRPNQTPFEGDPRYILKEVLKEAKDLGYTFIIGPECEFFLFHTDDNGTPTTVTHETAGYFDVGPSDFAENVRRDMVLNLENIGIEIEASHHEIAPAQHEIDFRYADGLETADNIMTFRMTVKTIAKRHGLHATFMPKPKHGVNGSGMHINISLADRAGNNIFYDPKDPIGLSLTARQFMAGILEHIRGLALLTNPLVNSYKRLVPGYDAPTYIGWSAASNRSPLIRVPTCGGVNTRIELRSPDSAMNPYLAFAGCLAAGLDGIKRKLTPSESVEENIFAMTEEERVKKGIQHLPETLGEAIEAFEEDKFLHAVLGEHITCKYLEAKKQEWSTFREKVTDWEVEEYLFKY